MNRSRIEHVNVSVRNPERTAAMLCELFDWKIRWQGPSQMGGRTVHVGTDDTYFAFSEASQPGPHREAHAQPGINHVGMVVDDADRISMHLARHSFADYARTKSGNLYAISKTLGHSSLQITQAYLKSFDQDAVDQLADELWSDQ